MLAEEENLQSCLGFKNLKNVPPSGLNFSCQYVWCISIEQFVATFLKLWIVALFIGYAVSMRFTRYYVILIYGYDSLMNSSFLNVLLAKHFLTRYLWMLNFALQGFVWYEVTKKFFLSRSPNLFLLLVYSLFIPLPAYVGCPLRKNACCWRHWIFQLHFLWNMACFWRHPIRTLVS